MRLYRPSPSPADLEALARQIAAYRAALVAEGIQDGLADRLTEHFQLSLLDLTFDPLGRGIETK